MDKKTSLQRKFMIFYGSTVLIPMIIMIVFFTYFFNKQMEKDFISLYQTEFLKIAELTQKELDSNSTRCLRFSNDTKLKSLLNPARKYESYMDSINSYYSYLEPIITNEFRFENMSSKIKIYYTNENLIPGYDIYIYADDKVRQTDIFQQAVQANGQMIWSYDQKTGDVIMAVKIKDINDRLYGVFTLTLSAHILEQYLTIQDADKMVLMLVDNEGMVISSNKKGIAGQTNSDLAVGGALCKAANLKQPAVYGEIKQYIFTYDFRSKGVMLPDWRIISLIPTNQIRGSVYSLRNALIISSVLILLVSCVLFVWQMNRQFGRLRTVMYYMRNAQKGEMMTIPLAVKKDEIDEIVQIYNYMVKGLEELIEVNYKNDIKMKNILLSKREAELYALQSQVNPHFIFNMLEVIRMKLITNKDRENARMVYLMSQMLRKSLAWKKEKIKFSEEIEFTSEYLELQSRLVEGNLHFKLVCQEELKSYCVLKFILQPLVENAIKHNNLHTGQELYVWVGASREIQNNKPIMRLWVADNGVGAPKEVFEEMERCLKDDSSGQRYEKETNSIGILNVDERIKHHYGKEYGIEGIMPFEKGGTGWVIELIIPLEHEE